MHPLFGGAVYIGAAFLISTSAEAQNLFVTDWPSGQLYEYTPSGVQTTYASLPGQGDTGLAFNRAGDLFVADERSGDIYEFTPNGQESIFASGLVFPEGLAFDSAGNLFVTSRMFLTGGQDILEFTPNGVGSIFASSGLSAPYGLAFQGVTLPAPEPSGLRLLAVSLAALLVRRRRLAT